MTDAAERVFPLVPRPHVLGVAAGSYASNRRGTGDETATLRAYRSGDSVRAIDWKASARLSAARADDSFLVKDTFADESPRVVVVVDRAPRMALYPARLPWLHKPAALGTAAQLIASSALAARGAIGYLDGADPVDPYWLPPQRRDVSRIAKAATSRPFTASADNLALVLAHLVRRGSNLASGTFVFVLSDFLVAPPLLTWRALMGTGWEIVPVIVQDPRWEQSFPDTGAVTLSLPDERGRARLVRLRARDAVARRVANEDRLVRLRDTFGTLDLESILLGSADELDALAGFQRWADVRRGRLRSTG